MQRELGSAVFAAQYQQDPIPREGNLVHTSWFKRYSEQTRPPEFDRIIISWDTASAASHTSDYSVGTVWGILGDNYYLLEVLRHRLEYPALRKLISKTTFEYNAAQVLLEKADSGRNLFSDLRQQETGYLYKAFIPRGSKEDRLAACSALVEEGRVWLPERAAWLSAFLSEITGFPNSKHDDQVDSLSQFLLQMRRGRGKSIVHGSSGRRVIVDRPNPVRRPGLAM